MQAKTCSLKAPLNLALGIDSLGIQSLKALAAHWVWLRAKVLGMGEILSMEKPSALAEGVFTDLRLDSCYR